MPAPDAVHNQASQKGWTRHVAVDHQPADWQCMGLADCTTGCKPCTVQQWLVILSPGWS